MRNSREVAGTTLLPHSGAEEVQVDDLTIVSLLDLLDECAHSESKGDCALLVTMDGHSTCYLFSRREGRVFHFDPFGATLLDVTERLDMMRRPETDADYNGLLMFANDDTRYGRAL